MATDREILQIFEQEAGPRIAKKIRCAMKRIPRSNPDRFQYLTNIMLREHWREEHGNTDEWDRAARAGGWDPAELDALVRRGSP